MVKHDEAVSESLRLDEMRPLSLIRTFSRLRLPSVNSGRRLLLCGNRVHGEKSVAESPQPTKDDWGGPEAEKLIIRLDDNFKETIVNYDSLIVFFFTKWCAHCKKLKPIYGEAAIQMKKDDVPGHLGAIDVTKRLDIADMFDIVVIPVLKYFRKGEFIVNYNDKRTVADIVKFMKNPPEQPTIISQIDI